MLASKPACYTQRGLGIDREIGGMEILRISLVAEAARRTEEPLPDTAAVQDGDGHTSC